MQIGLLVTWEHSLKARVPCHPSTGFRWYCSGTEALVVTPFPSKKQNHVGCTDICLFTHSVSKYLGTCKVQDSSRFSDDHRADPVFMEFLAESGSRVLYKGRVKCSGDGKEDQGSCLTLWHLSYVLVKPGRLGRSEYLAVG